MKPRLALINVRIEPRQYIPINLLTLAGFAESLAEIVVFDPEHYDTELSEIKSFKPDIIGISSMTTNYPRAKEIMAILKKEFGDKCRYIFGGIHPTLRPQEVFLETGADGVVVGEGEYALADILRGKPLTEIPAVYTGQENISRNPLIEDMDSIPMPAYHLMPDLEKYLIPPGHIRGTWQKRGTIALMSARGCAGKCIFCNSHLMFGRRVRRRSVDNLITEIKYVLEHYGKTSFWFADDTFTYHKTWVYDFCEKVAPLNIVWGVQGRSDTITDELVLKLKAAGCRQIDLGIESGSDRILEILCKGETREQHLRALHIVKKHKVRSLATIIIGTPGETLEDIEQTKSLIKETKPNIVNVFYMNPFPDSTVYKMAEERNLWIHKDGSTLGIHDRPMIADTLSEEEQIALRTELYNLNRWRNLAGFLKADFLIGFLGTLSPGRVVLLIKTLIHKNLHDAMYAYIQDYRKSRFAPKKREKSRCAKPSNP